MPNIEIKNRWTGKVLVCGKYESIKDCLDNLIKINFPPEKKLNKEDKLLTDIAVGMTDVYGKLSELENSLCYFLEKRRGVRTNGPGENESIDPK